MNIVKIQDDLKGMPDNYLVQSVQNPSPQIPTYLALAELQRRKKMRDTFQGAGQGGQEQPSVAEQLTVEPQPQMQGLASIPVENVGNEYAAGGIVAFEDGGEVQRYQNKGLVQLSPEELARLSPEEQTRYLAEQAAANQAALRGIGLFRLPQTAPTAATPQIRGTLPPLTESEMSQYKLPKAVEARPPMYQNVSSEALQNTPSVRTARDGAPITQAPATKQPSPGPSAAPRAPAQQGLASLYEVPADPYANFVPEQAVVAEDEMKRLQGLMGIDPFQAKAADRLAAMEGRVAKEEQTAPWMALAEAGFAIAGGDSPYALQNIGKGAQKGLESLSKAKERASAAEEKRFALESQLAQAQRAEQVAQARFGMDSEQADKARKRTEEQEVRKANADRGYRIADKKFEERKLKYEQDQQNKRNAMSIKAQKEVANKTPAEIQLIERYAAARNIPFDEAFQEIQVGKRTKVMTNEEITQAVLKADPMLAQDPVAFTAAVQAYKQAVSGEDFSGWGNPTKVKD